MNRDPRRPQAWLLAGAAVALGALLLAQPQSAAQGFAQGMRLCLHSLLPALFPFFVVCGLLVGSPLTAILGRPLAPLVRRWGLTDPAAPLTLLLAWLGGYAVCARSIAALRRSGQLDAAQAERLLLLGCCSGPGFVVGCLGGLLLGSVRVGVLLYALQIAANLLTTACLLPFLPPVPAVRPTAPPDATAAPDLPAAINGAVDSALQVCGCTVFFCVLAALLRGLLPTWPLAEPLLSAGLEITSGCAAFAAAGGAWALYGICLCLSLPGLSVFCQISALLGGTVPLARFTASRLLHLLWLQGLVRLCARWLPGCGAVFSSLQARVVVMDRLPPDAAVLCFFFLCCTLYKLRQTFYNKHSSAR